jgi:hypothetical protein
LRILPGIWYNALQITLQIKGIKGIEFAVEHDKKIFKYIFGLVYGDRVCRLHKAG